MIESKLKLKLKRYLGDGVYARVSTAIRSGFGRNATVASMQSPLTRGRWLRWLSTRPTSSTWPMTLRA
jgi:hypothetical protein